MLEIYLRFGANQIITRCITKFVTYTEAQVCFAVILYAFFYGGLISPWKDRSASVVNPCNFICKNFSTPACALEFRDSETMTG